MTIKSNNVKEGVATGFFEWLSEHPITTGDIIEVAVKKAITDWLDKNEQTIIDRIAQVVAKSAVSTEKWDVL